jgi:hypothetical protein
MKKIIITGIICLLTLAACFSPWQGDMGKSTFSITIGNGGGRAIDSLLWEPETKIAELEHTITMTNDSGLSIPPRDGVKAGKTVQFSVEPGHWVITVKAYLIVEGRKILKAEGFQPVDLKPGHNGAIFIDMKKPNGEITLVSVDVTKLPNKTQYNLGEELDTTGMVVMATYSDGSTAEVTEYDIIGYDKGKTGNHVITVIYYGKTDEFEVNVINPNLPTVATPTASPAGGEVAVNADITLTTATEGAKIYYTLDDTVPNETSTLYSDNNKPVITSGKLTLKAYAVKEEMNDSDILTVEYSLSATTNAQYPSITNPQGAEIIRSETAELSVTVSDLTDGGKLSFQWYSGRSSTNNTNGTPIGGANSASYDFITSTTTTPGNYYYYCAVTNTNTNVNGVQTATTTSEVATVIVYGTGTGTNDDPFIVYDVTTLERVGKDDWSLSAYYKQIRDIDLSSDVSDNWTPIGTSSNPFTGNYDGNDHTINNIQIYNNSGLFGCTGSTAVVKKIGIENCYGNPVSSVVGGVVGTNGGTIQYCYSTLIVLSTESTLGGVVGENIAGGKVENCYFIGNIHGSYNVGGVVGNNYGTVENCYTTGKVSGDGSVGGIVGNNYDRIVRNCYTTGDVSGGSNIGGVVGNQDGGTVENCYATGEVSGGSNVGGVVGHTYDGKVENCYATGKVSGSGDYAYIGGVVGYIEGSGEVKYCYATGEVSGSGGHGKVGGVVGSTYGGKVEKCYATGKVSGSGDYASVGGVVGEGIEAGWVINCYATGDVSGSGDNSSVGGVVGHCYGTVQNCYATGNISGSNDDGNVGGVVGANVSGSSLNNCVALNTNISGISVGRVVGLNEGYPRGNYGRSNMKRGGNLATWSDKTSNGLNGADITAAQWGVESWWTTAGYWDTESGTAWDFDEVWEWGGNLPILRNMPGMTQDPKVKNN